MANRKIVKTDEGAWEYFYYGSWYDKTLVIESIKRIKDVLNTSFVHKRTKRKDTIRVQK